MKNKHIFTFFVVLLISGITPFFASAQEMYNEYQGTFRAKVVKVTGERTEDLFDIKNTIQTLDAELLEGPQKGMIVSMENDFTTLKKG